MQIRLEVLIEIAHHPLCLVGISNFMWERPEKLLDGVIMVSGDKRSPSNWFKEETS
jgi:hypothetical protein